MQIQSKYNTRVKLLLPVDRGILVKTRSEAQSRVSRPYESRFSPWAYDLNTNWPPSLLSAGLLTRM